MKNFSAGLKRILVVEDEPALCELCLRVLTSENFEVDIAANGNVAREMLEKKDYDLYLIDIRTPVMNGKQLYQYIITTQGERAEKVVFATGDVADGYTRHFLELAGRPFLLKPFTPDELRTIIRQTLRQLEK